MIFEVPERHMALLPVQKMYLCFASYVRSPLSDLLPPNGRVNSGRVSSELELTQSMYVA